ncbi:hypothetical protein NM208_g10759 [Fusarium decemcellulare]|uniref:Uncharacterized protein n=1 Tax=Fusarium decemcellulare TaxID=57161 RepID=A0ACC1RWT1_9HYPO|nr:hypothetical protein NM208_g10759 [Fusarium decemcellulare]
MMEAQSGSLSDDDGDDGPRNQDHMGATGNPRSTIHSLQPKEKFLQTLISHRMNLWVVYKERVEPLTKLLHLPSLEQAVLETRLLSSVDGIQCIVLAVYYGAITSLSEEECILMFANSQAQVLSRMREELEKMFASVDLIHTGDIRPLQALVLYLVFLRHHDPRLSWKLTGLAVRLAQNFGLHREDSFLGLSKFEADMRRRLWWQLAIIEAPSAEDYSGEYNLLEMGSFDTHPPRNLDDAQLYPIMTEYPAERRGLTEMTFALARCQITSMYRCIADSRRFCGDTGKSYAELTPQERADWIDDCETGFSDKFLRDSSPSSAFQWVTIILTRMLFHKVRLHGCKPFHGATVTEEARERLFAVAVEVIELNYKLRTDPRTRPYLWLFSSYTQWHSFSLVLVWLQMDPLCKNARRAWEAVEKAVTLRWEHPPSLLNGRKPRQWKLIIRLMDKARSARREALSKRARKGSRSAADLRQSSIRVPLGSSMAAIQDSSAPTLTSQIAQPQGPSQPQQQQHTTTVAATGPLGPSSSEISVTSDSPLELQHNAPIQNPWVSAYENPIPDFTVENIVGPMSGQDLMMIDGEFSDDLEMQNFYLFDDIF